MKDKFLVILTDMSKIKSQTSGEKQGACIIDIFSGYRGYFLYTLILHNLTSAPGTDLIYIINCKMHIAKMQNAYV
jgi:hypothetical protein